MSRSTQMTEMIGFPARPVPLPVTLLFFETYLRKFNHLVLIFFRHTRARGVSVDLGLLGEGAPQVLDREPRPLRGLDHHLLAPGQEIDRRGDLLDRVVRHDDRAVAVAM